MFTGLIADLGEIVGAERSADGVRLTVASRLVPELSEGDSIAVNGVCLTATSVDAETGVFDADVMHETLRRSSLAEARAGGPPVNLELPLRATDRLGGHVVQGHVDATGEVVAIAEDGFSRRVEISAPPEILRYVVEKGSITIDGISLTVAELATDSLTVSLIPETLARTNLGVAEVGTVVNLEVDVLAKYVERLVDSRMIHAADLQAGPDAERRRSA
ncbi:MAG TPA: riboflavin synthase [Solirubrobacteraceae bacterium]|nr:riboflavin synthase [Solirubrobacteraceae bacterium]